MNEITSQADCGHYRCYGACGYQPPVKLQAPTADELLAEVKRQAVQIERLQHQADQADQIAVSGIVDALSWLGVRTPEGGTEAAAARLGRLVNDLSAAVLRHKMDHRNKCEEIERLKADLSRERAAHEETRLARNRARLDGIAEARKNLPPEIVRLKIEAAWYRLLRRGQHWSVIDGVGQTLRGEELDAAVAAVKVET